MSITFFMGAGPAVKPVRHFLCPDRIEGASADGPCRGKEVFLVPHVGAAPAGARKLAGYLM